MNCLNAEILKGLQERILAVNDASEIRDKIYDVFSVTAEKHDVIKIAGIRNTSNLLEFDLYNYYPILKDETDPTKVFYYAYDEKTKLTDDSCTNYDPLFAGISRTSQKNFRCGNLYKLYNVRARMYMIFLYANCVNDVFGSTFQSLLVEYSNSFKPENEESLKKLYEIGQKIKEKQGNENPFLRTTDYIKTLPKSSHVCGSRNDLSLAIAKVCDGHIKLNKMIFYSGNPWKNFSNESIFNNLVIPVHDKLMNYLNRDGAKYDPVIGKYISSMNYFYKPYQNYFARLGILPRPEHAQQPWMPRFRFANPIYDNRLIHVLRQNGQPIIVY